MRTPCRLQALQGAQCQRLGHMLGQRLLLTQLLAPLLVVVLLLLLLMCTSLLCPIRQGTCRRLG
jgi:hypothetical protein